MNGETPEVTHYFSRIDLKNIGIDVLLRLRRIKEVELSEQYSVIDADFLHTVNIAIDWKLCHEYGC